MSNWALIIYCGLITYLTRFSMIALIKKEMFNERIREVLSYVPSNKFPANPSRKTSLAPALPDIEVAKDDINLV